MGSPKGKTAIVIDDMKAMRNLNKVLLKTIGVEVLGEAENGAEAVELYKSTSPDVVLLDVEMPVMDGFQALNAIRKHDKAANIVMVTTLSNWSVTEACMMAGAIGYIQKDEAPDVIKERLVEVISSL
ncbi:MAG: response regulator [Rhodospirillales bacterium]